MTVVIIAYLGLLVGAAAAVYRLVVGPTLADRVIALDLLLVALMTGHRRRRRSSGFDHLAEPARRHRDHRLHGDRRRVTIHGGAAMIALHPVSSVFLLAGVAIVVLAGVGLFKLQARRTRGSMLPARRARSRS